MRVLQILARGIFVLSIFVGAHAQGTNTVLGQWDFNSNNLASATVGTPLQFIGGLQGAFVTNQINGRDAGVMQFPAASPQQSILATFSPVANGGGTNLNQYTILMDVMWPAESEGLFRSLFNASTNNTEDGAMFVNPDNQLGVFNDYTYNLAPNEWHRIALVYNLTNSTVIRYLDGASPAPLTLSEAGVDSRFSLNGGVLFFSDNDGETAPGFVNSIQLRAGLMTAAEIAALGGPSSGGLGAEPDPQPVGDVTLSIERSGNNIVIRLNPVRNAQLQKKVTLNDAAWQALETSSAGVFTVPIAEPTGFFRIEAK
jgi:hypothetical protein